ncbi:hypothetical protein ES706_06072 [subsurface metagenome]
MNNFKLEPADILVNVNERNDPYSVVKRWAAGPYDHVFIYMGRLGLSREGYSSSYLLNVPMLFESAGRGVVLQSLSNRYGEEVVVMRLKSEHDRKRVPYVLDEAIKLASDPQAHYDYLCIVKYILPRLICEKLGLPMPLEYHRDPWHVCSEGVFEVFYRAGLVDILYCDCVPPLPGDFVTDSWLLREVWRGELSELCLYR